MKHTENYQFNNPSLKKKRNFPWQNNIWVVGLRNAIKDGKFASQAYFHKKLIVCTSAVFAKMSYRKLINIWTLWIAQCLLFVAQQHSAIHPPHPCTLFHTQRKRYDITLIKVVHTFKMNAKAGLICHQSYWSTNLCEKTKLYKQKSQRPRWIIQG